MVGNKPRLYIALYPSGNTENEERKYHWGFLIGPKEEMSEAVRGRRCHVKNRPLQGWVYDDVKIENVRNSTQLLVRIVIAKVEDEKRLRSLLREVPIVQDSPDWRCRTWVANALRILKADSKALGTSMLDWRKIEMTAREYVAKKVAQGRFATSEDLMQPKPTWDLINNEEVVS
ncbi:hypothetical protein UVI_02061590 [Ustilaginoidea virens]|uniref:Uncharacterized protein n=1 Tax=Ustilaginoidea virens TaxID=1159556 RepID=A0A1B5LAQ1_USTVR|nr:hypothetical protein UVI_02061590 [Ustilaginoidea virens]